VEGLPDAPGSDVETPTEVDSHAPIAVLTIASSTPAGEAELSLVNVVSRPAILRVLDSFAEAGVDEVAVAVEPRLAPDIRNVLESAPAWPFTLSYLHRPSGEGLLDTLSAIGGTERDRPLLLHWACALFKTPLRHLLSEATVARLDAVLLVEPPHAEAPVVELASGRLAALPSHTCAGSPGRLAGLALLGAGAPEVARALRPGRGTDTDVVTLVERMTELGGHVQLLPAGDCWRNTRGADSALDLNRFLLSDLVADSAEVVRPGTLLQGVVQVDPSATLERSTIRGPVVIGARARLFDAWVGPYTSIGEGVWVEGAEVENSIVLEGARISHLDRRLESSVIGPGATICRDFRLPRALRLHVGEGATVLLT
jgi:glucose-1-phosphate thymidylyltransferase